MNECWQSGPVGPQVRPSVGDSGKAALRVRLADRERRYVVESGPAAIRKANSVSGRLTTLLRFPKGFYFENRSWQGPRRERGPFRNV